ncbi:Rhodanese-like domain-containing protein [Xylariaceae sp. FL0804]|nr:Rhodanese-like domain-containing protein [Xylariaceae sp. FL0804]KAI0474946.1 Rhodanese-like domain-containing protein [Xylariaceae sp. FL0804]
MEIKTISPQELRRHWVERREIALLDVREEGPYAEAHPFFALTVPVSEVETKLPALVPRLSPAPVVVYDDGEGYAARAAARIVAMGGYADVRVLDGGLSGYAAVGELFRDVNAPSKAFGELVEAIRHTPSLPAPEVSRVLKEASGGSVGGTGNGGDSSDDKEDNNDDKKNKNVVVLDARRYGEYHTMSVPQGQSCPGGELLYRVFEAAPDPSTTVIVHCAGRTRSIVGAQSLVNAGVPNRVVALRNGTIGWTLDGGLPPLDVGATRRAPPPSEPALRRARAHARAWALDRVGVSVVDGATLRRFAEEARSGSRTLYLLDVRDPDEYDHDHPRGFRSAPGGQLVQATDEWVGVRGARVVLYDAPGDGVRAPMAASWLLQLGWDVHVLEPGAELELPEDLLSQLEEQSAAAACRPPSPSKDDDDENDDEKNEVISVEALAALLPNAGTVVDLARSPAYRRGHIPGAWFASGPELARDLHSLTSSDHHCSSGGPIVLTSPDGRVAAGNLAYAREAVGGSSSPRRRVLRLSGGTQAWRAAGRDLEFEASCRWLSEPRDVYKRPYEGTENAREAMQGYLDWEYGLVAQLANDGIAGFHVVRP